MIRILEYASVRIVAALVSRRRSQEMDMRRSAADAHRDEALSRSRSAEAAKLEADEKAARAERARLDAEDTAARARQEREALGAALLGHDEFGVPIGALLVAHWPPDSGSSAFFATGSVARKCCTAESWNACTSFLMLSVSAHLLPITSQDSKSSGGGGAKIRSSWGIPAWTKSNV